MNLSQIGQVLSQERRKQSKTLENISKQTCIRVIRLKQIEDGFYDKGLAPIHIQGFIRAYAKALGLSVQQFDWFSPAVHEEKLKLTEVKNVDKELNPVLTIVNMSFMLAILIFTGLIFWMRMALNQYESQTAQVQKLPLEMMDTDFMNMELKANFQKFPLNNTMNQKLWNGVPFQSVKREPSSLAPSKKILKTKKSIKDEKSQKKDLEKASAYFKNKSRI